MYSPDIVSLIKSLCSTQSPAIRLSTLLDHILQNRVDINQDGAQELLRFFQEQVSVKQKAGTDAVASRWQDKPKGKRYSKPIFVQDYTAHQACKGCGTVISGSDAFRWKQPDKHYDDYHPLPACWPKEHALSFSSDTAYQRAMMPKE